jgi:hypothetical protein
MLASKLLLLRPTVTVPSANEAQIRVASYHPKTEVEQHTASSACQVSRCCQPLLPLQLQHSSSS